MIQIWIISLALPDTKGVNSADALLVIVLQWRLVDYTPLGQGLAQGCRDIPPPQVYQKPLAQLKSQASRGWCFTTPFR